MNSAFLARVEGRVQGVFFRASTRDKARSLGLGGWVRNLADGSVEVYASGASADLAKLQAWLKQGPEQARVDSLRVESRPYAPEAEFLIR